MDLCSPWPARTADAMLTSPSGAPKHAHSANSRRKRGRDEGSPSMKRWCPPSGAGLAVGAGAGPPPSTQLRVARELAHIHSTAPHGLAVRTEGDNLMNWDVSMRFPPGGRLGTQLEALGLSAVRVSVDFPDVFPACAPRLTVVYPRLCVDPALDDALHDTCTNVFTPSVWDADMSVADVLTQAWERMAEVCVTGSSPATMGHWTPPRPRHKPLSPVATALW